MKKIKIVVLLLIAAMALLCTTGCNWFESEFGRLKSSLEGRTAVIQTYDEEGELIDSINGQSIDIRSEEKFNMRDSEGTISSPSAVLNVTIGGRQMFHVGSSLILYDQGLVDYIDEYKETAVQVENNDASTPFIDRFLNKFDNAFDGKQMLILIRSQSGKPIASFAGESVSIFSTGIDKSTGVIIDDMYMFIYRCDYTIYEMDLITAE